MEVVKIPVDLVNTYDNVVKASKRIAGNILRTPFEYSYGLSDLGSNCNVYIKLENEQATGSFKLRGATNKIKILLETNEKQVKKDGFITASSGNHGLACAYAMNRLGVPGTIYVPKNISPAKDALLQKMGANVKYHGSDCVDAETQAREDAQKSGLVYVSPYNDFDVMCGNGTIGLEIIEDLPDVDTVLVSVGGGGMIAGIAACLKHAKPSVKIIGCQPVMSKVMYESVKAGHILFEESGETLSDGTAGGIEQNSVTFDFCCQLVDEWILVEESSIADGIYCMMEQHHKVVEGSAGLAVAAYMTNVDKFKDSTVVIVSCGANISMDKLKRVINKSI